MFGQYIGMEIAPQMTHTDRTRYSAMAKERNAVRDIHDRGDEVFVFDIIDEMLGAECVY